ncbi:hypothetical protein ACWGI8_40035 [Streptomyces sp. NPDC054841]
MIDDVPMSVWEQELEALVKPRQTHSRGQFQALRVRSAAGRDPYPRCRWTSLPVVIIHASRLLRRTALDAAFGHRRPDEIALGRGLSSSWTLA